MKENKSYPRSRGKKPKGISRELRVKIEENTKINDKHIKFFTLNETKEDYLSQKIIRELITIKGGG